MSRPPRRLRRWLAAGGAGALVAAGAALVVTPAQLEGPRAGPEAPVTAMNQTTAPANNSPVAVPDPTDARVVALANRVDAPDFSCALSMSFDGGGSWLPARPVSKLPAGVEKCYAPEVAFDAGGRLHYLFVGLEGRGNKPVGAFLATSDDRGATFSEPRRMLDAGNFAVRMAIDPGLGARGRLHLVWLHAGSEPALGGFAPSPNPIMSAYSDDGGATLSEPVQVSDPDRARVVAPVLALGRDHAVHVGYYDLGRDAVDYQGLEGPVWPEPWSLLLSTSTDGGRRFAPSRVVDDAIMPPGRVPVIFTMAPPALAVGGDRVCLAWTDGRYGDPDALARCGTADGWQPVVRLNDDPRSNGLHQDLPRLALAPGGRLDAVFADRRDDPGNGRTHVYYTYSTDGGRRFAASRRLSGEPSDVRVGQRYAIPSAAGYADQGARLALVTGRRSVLAAWADSRNSLPASGTEQDITAVRLRFTATGEARRGVGAGLVGVGVLVLGALVRHRLGWFVLAAAAVVAVAVAGIATGGQRAAAGPRAPVVDVVMREYSYDYVAPRTSGRVVFRVRNEGTENHEIGVYRLPDDLPPIDKQLHQESRSFVRPEANLAVRRPGQEQTFALDLVPGQRYAFLCFVLDEADEFHALKGMNSEFRAPR